MEQLRHIVAIGATDVQIAKCLGISEATLNNYKNEYPEFLESLTKWRAEFDARVEDSLLHRALGYTHKAERIFIYRGKVIRAEYIEHYPPDSTALVFWLKNRQPEKWRDKQEIELKGYLHPHLANKSDSDLEKEAHDLADKIVRARTAPCPN